MPAYGSVKRGVGPLYWSHNVCSSTPRLPWQEVASTTACQDSSRWLGFGLESTIARLGIVYVAASTLSRHLCVNVLHACAEKY